MHSQFKVQVFMKYKTAYQWILGDEAMETNDLTAVLSVRE